MGLDLNNLDKQELNEVSQLTPKEVIERAVQETMRKKQIGKMVTRDLHGVCKELGIEEV